MPTPVVLVDVVSAQRSLVNVRVDQLPYATALALTRTARDAMYAVRDKLPSQFTLRNAWTQRGVQFKQATKGNLSALVYFDRDYMYLQEMGGIKTPTRSAHIAVPLDPDLRNRTIPRSMRPRYILGNDLQGLLQSASYKGKAARKKRIASFGKGFILQTKGKLFIALRTGQGQNDIRILYVLVPAVHITQRLGMVTTVENTVRANFSKNYQDAMNQAVRTAR
jgi:hypothetical protein